LRAETHLSTASLAAFISSEVVADFKAAVASSSHFSGGSDG
jgi:hypothetical protein